MDGYILALDQGTTSSRAILFDHKGNIKGISQKEFRQIFPKAGWVEHDAMDIWATQSGVCREVLERNFVRPTEVKAIGITNQRETTIIWEKSTGKPVYNAIVWQCRRTAEICEKLREDGYENLIFEKTGLKLDAYFSATKIKWILDNVEGARERAERGELLFGTVDTWIVWNLTRGKVHITTLHANLVDDTDGVYIVPAFTGLGAPYWDMNAKGAIFGLTRGTKREHIIRAMLESIAYQCVDVFTCIEEDTNIKIQNLKVDGGASANGFLLQFQSNMLNTEVTRPEILETTAMGCAFLAGLAVGFWKNTDEIKNIWRKDKTFYPNLSEENRNRKIKGWEKAVIRTFNWDKDEE